MNILPVILCGGIGERVQPFLNSKLPKQFNSIHSERSLLYETIARVQGSAFLPPVLFGQKEQEGILKGEMSDFKDSQVFLEPFRRNTAAPVILSVLHAFYNDIENVVVMPSDHIIRDAAGFRDCIKTSCDVLNSKGAPIAYLGISPDRAFTEYGYISEKDGSVYFHEKPDLKIAAELIKNGAFWNSGIFLIHPKLFLKDFRQIDEALLLQCMFVFDALKSNGNLYDIAEGVFKNIPDISFDKAYCEKTDKGILRVAEFDWIDIGSEDMLEKARAS